MASWCHGVVRTLLPLALAGTLPHAALAQAPLVGGADQPHDALIVREPRPAPIVWGSSNAFRLNYDLRHWGGEPAVQMDGDLVAKWRRARDESLAKAHQQLLERTRVARERAREPAQLSSAD
jgi:hypothetical protein